MHFKSLPNPSSYARITLPEAKKLGNSAVSSLSPYKCCNAGMLAESDSSERCSLVGEYGCTSHVIAVYNENDPTSPGDTLVFFLLFASFLVTTFSNYVYLWDITAEFRVVKVFVSVDQ